MTSDKLGCQSQDPVNVAIAGADFFILISAGWNPHMVDGAGINQKRVVNT